MDTIASTDIELEQMREFFILNKKDIVKEIDVLLDNIQNLRESMIKMKKKSL